MYGDSSSLLFIPAISTSKPVIQPKTNFITSVWKWRFCRIWTVLFPKNVISSSKLWCSIKWLVSSASEGWPSVSELKCICAETFPGFLCWIIISFTFLFPLSILVLCELDWSLYFLSSSSLVLLCPLDCSLS